MGMRNGYGAAKAMDRTARWGDSAKPELHMVDGGQPSPWSLRGMGNAISSGAAAIAKPFQPPPGYVPATVAPPPAPAMAAPAPAMPQLGGMNLGAMQTREKAAGLRDGGDLRTGEGGNVPGQGSGDKIPAKYEPGEFVVSNDMLDMQPGLREGLHNLRDQALARKGMTPAQADASAVQGGGIRAIWGGDAMSGAAGWVKNKFSSGDGGAAGGGAVPDAAPAAPPAAPPAPGNTLPRRPGSMGVPGMTPQGPSAPIPNSYALPTGVPDSGAPSMPISHGAAEAAHGAAVNPVPQPEGYMSPGYADHFGGGTQTQLGAVDTGAKDASKLGSIRNFFSSGESAGGIGAAIKSVGSPLLSGAGTVARVVGKGLAPVGAAAAAVQGLSTGTDEYANRLDQGNEAPASTPGRQFVRDLGTRAMGIGGDVIGNSGASTDQYARRFGIDNSNPSFIKDAGIRALGAGDDFLHSASFGLLGHDPKDDRPDKGVVSGPGGSATNAGPANPANPVGTPGAAGAPQGAQGPWEDGFPATAPTPAPAPGSGGRPDIGAGTDLGGGIRRFDGGSSPLFSNMPNGGYEGNNALMGRGKISVQNQGAMDGIQARQDIHDQAAGVQSQLAKETADAAATNRAGGFGTGAPGSGGLRGQLEAQLAGKTLTRAGAEVAMHGDSNDATRMGHQLAASTSIRNNELTNAVANQGHILTNQNARARMSYDINKDARDFSLHKQEADQKMTESDRTARAGEDAAVEKNLESRFRTQDPRTGADVPDHAKIAEFKTALGTTMPQMAKELEATGNPQAIAKAADLRKRGPAALEPGDIADMHQLLEQRQRQSDSRGLLPGAATHNYSDNLLDYRQLPGAAGVDSRMLGGNHIVNKAGSVSVNDMRYKDGPANSFFPDVNKQQSTNLTRGIRNNP